MNSTRIYNEIIAHRQTNTLVEGYSEKHHILPRSLGGRDEITNIVKLTAREHFICHLLLTEIYRYNKSSHAKMVKAFGMMMWLHGENQQRYTTSHTYAKLREEFAKVQSLSQKGIGNSQFGKQWITDGVKNKKIFRYEIVPVGWRYGRVSQGIKKKYINNGKECKQIPISADVPLNWVLGRLLSATRCDKCNFLIGSRCAYKNHREKCNGKSPTSFRGKYQRVGDKAKCPVCEKLFHINGVQSHHRMKHR